MPTPSGPMPGAHRQFASVCVGETCIDRPLDRAVTCAIELQETDLPAYAWARDDRLELVHRFMR